MNNKNLVIYLLRIGIASVFLYAAIASFITPANWIGYLPVFLRKIFPAETLLTAFSLYEIILSIWVLTGRYAYYSALVSCATLIGIMLTNIYALDIIFRDLAILFTALALAAASYKKK